MQRPWPDCSPSGRHGSEPDAVLTNLPVTLPDHWFASVTHLNSVGSVEFSDRLAAEVKRARLLSR